MRLTDVLWVAHASSKDVSVLGILQLYDQYASFFVSTRGQAVESPSVDPFAKISHAIVVDPSTLVNKKLDAVLIPRLTLWRYASSAINVTSRPSTSTRTK